jgi:hypothetical protein
LFKEQALSSLVDDDVQEKTEAFAEKFRNLKEDFDRGVNVKVLEIVQNSGKPADYEHWQRMYLIYSTRHSGDTEGDQPGRTRKL